MQIFPILLEVYGSETLTKQQQQQQLSYTSPDFFLLGKSKLFPFSVRDLNNQEAASHSAFSPSQLRIEAK